jgi:hypothetical protein
MKALTGLLLTFAIVAAMADRACPADVVAEDQKLFDYLLSGFKTARDALKTGRFTAEGREIVESKKIGRREKQLKLFYAFDFSKGLLRFDSTETPQADAAGNVRIRGGRLIITPTVRIAQSATNLETVLLYPPDSHQPPQIAPFDVRVLGIASSRSIRLNYSLDVVYEAFRRNRKIQAISAEPSGIHRVTVHFGDPPSVQQTIWFDSERGFSPTRSELRKRKPGAELNWVDEPYNSSELTWEEHKGVWVPKTVVLVDRASSSTLRRELTFDWQDVNQSIADGTFTAHDFGLKLDDRIVDMRGARPVTVERIGRPAVRRNDLNRPGP